MNSKEMLYMIAIAESGSLSRAAENLDMSQSSLSRSLQKIENSLNVSLFKRTPGGLIPTDAGKKYLLCAKQIIKMTRNLENEISQISHLQSGHLIIGTTSQFGAVVLPEILRTFNGVYPGIEIELVEKDPNVIETKLLDGSVDLALLHLPLTNTGIPYQQICSESLLLAVPASDAVNDLIAEQPGSDLPFLDLQLVSNRNFILTHPTQGTRRATQRILDAAGIRPRIKFETSNILTAMRLVSFGLGVSIVPSSYCSMLNNISASVRFYRIEERCLPYWELVVCFLSEDSLTEAALEFIQICKTTLPYLFKG